MDIKFLKAFVTCVLLEYYTCEVINNKLNIKVRILKNVDDKVDIRTFIRIIYEAIISFV